MAIDFSKVTFNEKDADELPIQYFFNLEISSEELHTIIEKKDYEEMSSDNEDFISASDLSAELCLSSFDYCSNDCKLEMVITDSYASQIWIVIESMASMDTVDKLMNFSS